MNKECETSVNNTQNQEARYTLPLDFLYGAAASGFQNELPDPFSPQSDWHEFILKNGIVYSNEVGPHWDNIENAKRDLDTLRNLGLNSVRLGIEWARVMPEDAVNGQWKTDEAAVKYYRELVDYAEKLGLKPMLTLYHFALPLWASRQGGWESKRTTRAFTFFAERIAEAFNDVELWVTVNEPNTLIGMGYITGYFPPEKKSIIAAITATKNLIQANDISFYL